MSDLRVLEEARVGWQKLKLMVRVFLWDGDICTRIRIYNSRVPWNNGILADPIFLEDKRQIAAHLVLDQLGH